jgi:hypothetical protein
VWSESTRWLFRWWVPALWEAALISAVLLPATVTFLSNLHYSIPTDGSLWFCKPKLSIKTLLNGHKSHISELNVKIIFCYEFRMINLTQKYQPSNYLGRFRNYICS